MISEILAKRCITGHCSFLAENKVKPGFLQIKTQGAVYEDLKAEIVDLNGRLPSTNVLSPDGENSLSLNCLKSGTYIIKFYLGNKSVASEKFINISCKVTT